MSVTLGKRAAPPPGEKPLQILCDDAEQRRHAGRPWFRADAAERLGGAGSAPAAGRGDAVEADFGDRCPHAFLCGTTGGGKSRLMLHLVWQQVEAGCSAVVIDPKGETFDCLVALAAARGYPPERVTLLDPSRPGGVPGWNPLAAGVPAARAAADIVHLVKEASSSSGHRLEDLLTNNLLFAASHGLSLYEAARLLVRDDYREALLRLAAAPDDPAAFEVAADYLRDEYGNWSRSERAQAAAPVLNRIRELLRSGFLRPLLCARRTTLDLARLWREPRLVFVRLDRATLGEEGARMLAGLVVHLLLRTALRAQGPVPVVLAIDEVPLLERFVGSALQDMLAVARSQRLRLLVACQHLEQLSDGLRAALLANAALQAFFRLGYTDARLAAASLAAGAEPRLMRVTAAPETADRRTGRPPLSVRRHRVRDAWGRPLRVAPGAWERLAADCAFASDPLEPLEALAGSAGTGRLYVRAADGSGPQPLRTYVAGLRPHEYWVDGPRLALAVAFPRPKLTAADWLGEAELARLWTRTLQQLPVQHAVVRIAGKDAAVVRVADLEVPRPGEAALERFRETCAAANGQTAAECDAARRWREAEVERVAAGRGGAVEIPEEDDGSLA